MVSAIAYGDSPQRARACQSIYRSRSIPSMFRAMACWCMRAETSIIYRNSISEPKTAAFVSSRTCKKAGTTSDLASTTIFRTKSFDGTPIESALMRPADARPGEKLPLVLLVHGGPSSQFFRRLWLGNRLWAQLLAAHGYEVLMVNPRGSNGYSEDFVKANRGDWGGGDYKDLMAVLDAVIAHGDTDPEPARHRRLVLWRRNE